MTLDIRKGMPSSELSRDVFERRFKRRFADPAFSPLGKELEAITAAAWDAYVGQPQGAAHPQGRPGLRRP